MNPELAAIGVFRFCSRKNSHTLLGESRFMKTRFPLCRRIEDLGPGDVVKVDWRRSATPTGSLLYEAGC